MNYAFLIAGVLVVLLASDLSGASLVATVFGCWIIWFSGSRWDS